MTRENIAAFTEPNQYPPGYISITLEENGNYSTTVRSTGDKGIATLEMTPEQLRLLATDILTKLGALVTNEMVARFICWQLPQDFYPDCHISFDREKVKDGCWPTGTNILSAEQARKMLEYVIQKS